MLAGLSGKAKKLANGNGNEDSYQKKSGPMTSGNGFEGSGRDL